MSKTRQNHMRQADRWFSKYIRARDGACVACGSTEYLQCAHVHSRSYKSIRTNPDNAYALCRGCHVKFTHRPIEWRQFIEELQPGVWEDLAEIALRYEKVDWKFQAEYWKEQAHVVA